MAEDKDLGELTEAFEEEIENLKNTKMKVFGITVTPTTIGAAFAILSSIIGGLYGAFQVYDDYMGMKEIIANIDTGAIEARNNEIEIKLEEAIAYTRDIKNGLKDDILRIEQTTDRVERDMRELEIRVGQALDDAEARIKATQVSIEATLEGVRGDMNQQEKDVTASIREVEGTIRESEKDVRDTMRDTEERIDSNMRTLRTDLEMRLQEALDNPLAGR